MMPKDVALCLRGLITKCVESCRAEFGETSHFPRGMESFQINPATKSRERGRHHLRQSSGARLKNDKSRARHHVGLMTQEWRSPPLLRHDDLSGSSPQ